MNTQYYTSESVNLVTDAPFDLDTIRDDVSGWNEQEAENYWDRVSTAVYNLLPADQKYSKNSAAYAFEREDGSDGHGGTKSVEAAAKSILATIRDYIPQV